MRNSDIVTLYTFLLVLYKYISDSDSLRNRFDKTQQNTLIRELKKGPTPRITFVQEKVFSNYLSHYVMCTTLFIFYL